MIRLPISCPVYSAVTCHDPIAYMLLCAQRYHLSWSRYYCQSPAVYTMLSPVMIPMPISCPVYSAVTCHHPITTANLLPYTQSCHVSCTALSPVMIPLLLPISCPMHTAVTCHDNINNLLPCTQRCHLSWSHYLCQSLALYIALWPVMIPLLLSISRNVH